MPPPPLRIGTRGSKLAIAQSHIVADALRGARPGLPIEIVPIHTAGDADQVSRLDAIGNKGVFTKAIEVALLEGRIDLAVHSLKDVPIAQGFRLNESPMDLAIVGVLPRADPRDVLICRQGEPIAAWNSAGATIGTSSVRRAMQLRTRFPKARCADIRGNIDGRLAKLRSGEFDAIVLALAGLQRAGLFEPATMSILDLSTMLPAPGQGVIALQARQDDAATIEHIAAVNHPQTQHLARLEREIVARLGCDCHSPIAVLAHPFSGRVRLDVAFALTDNSPELSRLSVQSGPGDPMRAVDEAAEQVRIAREAS